MTLILGQAFPIYYLFAMFAITVQYITERISLATFYRMPKPNGLEITFANNRLITIGPFLAMAAALWQHGNKAMFS
jgi:hypothetical protein